MKLFGTSTSPFVHKVRIFAAEKGIALDFVVDRPVAPESRVPELNPLGKVPVLLLDDGETVYDSVVIVEYLDGLKREPQLIPEDPRARMPSPRRPSTSPMNTAR